MALDPSLAIVLEEARTALSQQAKELEALRGRTTQLLGSAGLVRSYESDLGF